jgi:hypothetical protein
MAKRKLEVVITGQRKGLSKTLDGASGDVDTFAGKMKKGLSGAALAVGAAATAGVVGLGFVLKGAWDAAEESAKISRETARVIDTTGAAAWTSADAVGALSTNLSNLTGADDELVQSGANLLLTFTNVQNKLGAGNDIFDRAVGLSLDMATALGTDMSGASLQLGKALNDPIKGITALSRAGVSFTADQKKQIKTLTESGDVLGAQRIVLDELAKEFGGAAAAAATPFDKLGVMVGNLQEQVGTALIPVVSSAADWLGKQLPKAAEMISPIVEEVGRGFQAFFGALVDGGDDITSSGFAGVLEGLGVTLRNAWDAIASIDWGNVFATVAKVAQPILAGLGKTISWIGDNLDTVLPVVIAIGSAYVGWKVATFAIQAVTAAQAVLNVVMSANPIGLVVAALAALVAGLVYAYQNVDWFRSAVDAAWSALSVAIDWVKDHWQLALTVMMGPVGLLASVVISNWDKISAAISWAWNTVIKPIWDGIVWFIQNMLIPYYQALWAIAQTVWNGIASAVSWAWNNVIQPAWQALQAYINNVLIPVFNTIKSVVSTAWAGISWAISSAWGGISTVFGWLTSAIDGIKGAFSSIADVVSSVFNGLLAPIRAAIDGVRGFWNNNIAGKGSFHVPFTDIGFDGIPRLHSGGTFNAPTPGGQGLALLRDRERISVPGNVDAGSATSGGVTYVTKVEVTVQGHVRADQELAETIRSLFIKNARTTPGSYLPGVIG